MPSPLMPGPSVGGPEIQSGETARESNPSHVEAGAIEGPRVGRRRPPATGSRPGRKFRIGDRFPANSARFSRGGRVALALLRNQVVERRFAMIAPKAQPRNGGKFLHPENLCEFEELL